MKKILILVLCAFMLISCSAQYEGEPFLPFAGEFETDVSLQIGDTRSSFSYSSKEDTVCFLSPQEISGYKLYESNGQIFLSYQELVLPLSSESGAIFKLCQSAFAVKKATEISTRNDADRVLTVIKADDYTYTFSSGGEPLSVSGVFNGQEFKMDIDRFEITQK